MKMENYKVFEPDSYAKSYHILGKEINTTTHYPIVYFIRPKWIKDDKV